MGYKFGLWLVPTQSLSETTHLQHFTIMCHMSKQEALSLYDVIKSLEFEPIQVKGKGLVFPNQYEEDCLEAWGYEATSPQWSTLKTLSSSFKGSFSATPHISLAYATDSTTLKVSNIEDVAVSCTVHVADICSENPEEWILVN